ncbi:NAD-dependent epimerase/dehydratase family protein [Dellaglioa algida]|uniref:Nucleoside-diphosphate-sugar epimerase n=1 Tax=Dellaglioa algida DSM 15638 TaxID=1423719 RepID=A0A0R1HGB7_9LACO|nr:NAD-dependent epimerase/dehydratase family protein [Dellaglioa algida]KRK45518.1 nucleoside-diphosphate-sugar epimerase [Dellaglioa algida DSM 15638]MDK1732051.1 NAD-dependent epimerase/dehydratase family protein [Dellaglioa algida]MDK1733577.1 NAD-dependent epimerase/dehydratase family protein [Dellaglioa algida]
MKKILVTGGAGFIGSSLVDELIKDKDNVITIIDDLSMGKRENIPNSEKISFYEKSVCDYKFMEELLINEKFEYIYHLAAVASVADSIERPSYTHKVNLESTLNILETIRENDLPITKLLFSSSAAVYGNDPALPKKETSLIKPMTPYAIDKFSSEQFVLRYGELYDIQTVAVRFFNVYGPKQNPKSPYSGVLSILKDSIDKDRSFKVFGDGEQYRDFIFINDVVGAIIHLAVSPKCVHEVYNVGTGKKTSLNAVIKNFQKILNSNISIEYVESRTGDIKYSYAEIDKLLSTGFKPVYSISQGLKVYLK